MLSRPHSINSWMGSIKERELILSIQTQLLHHSFICIYFIIYSQNLKKKMVLLIKGFYRLIRRRPTHISIDGPYHVVRVSVEARNLRSNNHVIQERLEDFMWLRKAAYIHSKTAITHILIIFKFQGCRLHVYIISCFLGP